MPLVSLTEMPLANCPQRNALNELPSTNLAFDSVSLGPGKLVIADDVMAMPDSGRELVGIA